MTAPTKPTIDEMIELFERTSANKFAERPVMDAILSTLRAHKAIMEAKRPEPVAWILPGDDIVNNGGWIDARVDRWCEFTKPLYGPDLLDYADRMAAERDAERDRGDQWEITATNLLNRAETAERQLTELQAEHDTLVKDAERYRWLLHDHDAAETRERRRSICENLSVKSYSSVSRDIDAAMSAVALDEEGE